MQTTSIVNPDSEPFTLVLLFAYVRNAGAGADRQVFMTSEVHTRTDHTRRDRGTIAQFTSHKESDTSTGCSFESPTNRGTLL